MTEQQSFDYIVIGSGASGAVVANRLSADPSRRVLLLEAGPGYDKPDLSDVGGFVRLWGSDVDWSLATEPQVGMAGRQITINQGKVAGGSTRSAHWSPVVTRWAGRASTRWWNAIAVRPAISPRASLPSRASTCSMMWC